MNIGEIKTWDNYRWEQMFREIDGEIFTYFKELPSFIDLPAEEDLLIDKMANWDKGDEYYEVLDCLFDSFPEDLDDDDFDDNDVDMFHFQNQTWEVRQGAEIFNELNDLAVEWAERMAEGTCIDIETGLQVLSLYGMILKETMYILEVPQDFNNFIHALARRLHAKINTLAEIMRSIRTDDPGLASTIEKHTSGLAKLMDKAAEICCVQAH